MNKTQEFPGCVIAVLRCGLSLVLVAPEEVFGIMDGHFLDDNGPGVKLQPGIYWATLEYWFEQGYDDCGRPCVGECEWEMRVSNATVATVS